MVGRERMKPYYQDEFATIYLGDCREIMPTLEGASVDVVLSDPPYGVGKAEWDKRFDASWLLQAGRIARDVVGVMPGTSNLLSMPRGFGWFDYRWTLAVRITNGMTRGPFGFGNWFPCVVYARDGVSLFQDNGVQDATEVVIDGTMPDHPSPKPQRAINWLLSRLPGQSVLDPFMGSGTTLAAAKLLGRKSVGIECEEKYAEIAARRLSQEVLAL